MSRTPSPAGIIPVLCTIFLVAFSIGAQEVRDPLRPDAPPLKQAEEETGRADLSQANKMVQAGDFQGAAGILAPLLETYPEDPALLLMLGEVRLALGQPDQALPVLEKAAEIQPRRLRLQFQLGSALASTGKTEEALAAFAQELENNDNLEVRVMCLLNRSFLLQNLKQWEDAASQLVQVAELDPTKAQVYGDAASLYIQAGKPQEAQKVLDAGEPLGFVSAQHTYSLGAAFYKDNDYEAAAAAYRRCLEIKPSFYKAERGLGLALEKSGKEDEAAAHFRKYLELKPDARDRDRILEAIGDR